MGISVFNNDLLMYFPNKCGSTWAESQLYDYIVEDVEQAREIAKNCRTVLVSRPPVDFFTSGYRWCCENSSVSVEIGLEVYLTFDEHLQVCIGEAFKFNLGLTGYKLTGYAEHSWAGPSLQFEYDISGYKVPPWKTVALGSKEMFDICNTISHTPVDITAENRTDKNIPVEYSLKNVRRLNKLYDLNKRWAGFESIMPHNVTDSEPEPETEG